MTFAYHSASFSGFLISRILHLHRPRNRQDLCRLEAAHVVGEREGRGESSGPLSREELIEALTLGVSDSFFG